MWIMLWHQQERKKLNHWNCHWRQWHLHPCWLFFLYNRKILLWWWIQIKATYSEVSCASLLHHGSVKVYSTVAVNYLTVDDRPGGWLKGPRLTQVPLSLLETCWIVNRSRPCSQVCSVTDWISARIILRTIERESSQIDLDRLHIPRGGLKSSVWEHFD